MPQAVRDKAREIDALIEANAAAARGEAPAADTDPAADPESALGVEDTQQGAEVLDFQEADQDDDTGADPMADFQQQLNEARQAAETAEQRWRSLDGQLRSKDEQIERLTELVAKMTDHAPAKQEAPVEPAGVSKDDADTFGDDMVDFVQRVARDIARREIANLVSTLDGLEAKVKDVEQHTAVAVNDSFQTKLSKLAPGWEKFDTDQGFHDWLSESSTRKRLFGEAAEGRDAPGVAEFFNMYATKVAAEAEPQQRKASDKARKLEAQVQPGKGRTTRTQAQDIPTGQPRTWTRTEIAQNYQKYSQGKFTKEEWAKLEQEMAIAQRDDRVDYSR